MKIRHQREKDLMPHYEAHPKYYSFADSAQTMTAVFTALGKKLNETKSILDVGCGSGGLAKVFATESSADYTGVDYCSIRVNIAKLSNTPNSKFHLDDVYEFLEKEIELGNKYDTITIFEVLEHLEEPELIIQMAKTLLTSNGSIIASVPHNMPYVAHLQVYENESDVKKKLNPEQILFADGKHYFCRWDKINTQLGLI